MITSTMRGFADMLLTGEGKYQVWKRHNISELIEEYKKDNHSEGNFERYCREMFKRS